MDEATRIEIEKKRDLYKQELTKFVNLAQDRIARMEGAIRVLDELLLPGEENGTVPADRQD